MPNEIDSLQQALIDCETQIAHLQEEHEAELRSYRARRRKLRAAIRSSRRLLGLEDAEADAASAAVSGEEVTP